MRIVHVRERERARPRSNIHPFLLVSQNYRAPFNHKEVGKCISTAHLERKENQMLLSNVMITKH